MKFTSVFLLALFSLSAGATERVPLYPVAPGFELVARVYVHPKVTSVRVLRESNPVLPLDANPVGEGIFEVSLGQGKPYIDRSLRFVFINTSLMSKIDGSQIKVELFQRCFDVGGTCVAYSESGNLTPVSRGSRATEYNLESWQKAWQCDPMDPYNCMMERLLVDLI
jgi:hypothetical protein